ncbi:MAG: ATP-dependent 6-phosphofructokinase [Acidobacteriota bacterium]|nr:ATP-dependent 6-phosphofructokinase [Acidobacteriota bacterium]
MKKIGIITRDCAGVNAAIRAVVRTAHGHGIETVGIVKGYEGLIEGIFMPLNRRSVSGIINKGGTILKTARCEEFYTSEGQARAIEKIRGNGIDGLIVIGGNGSLAGAHVLASRYHIPTIGVAATIDNDVNGVALTIGADTAVNVALDALDKIRDTATSLERIFVVEVMGRDCGYIALEVALAGGCEEVLVTEKKFDMKTICDEIETGNAQGKVSWIIIVAEGAAKADTVASAITLTTGLETRVAVLGHIQRGGQPTALDRSLASRLGHLAVEALLGGETDKCVHISEGLPALLPLETAVQPKETHIEQDYHLIKILS